MLLLVFSDRLLAVVEVAHGLPGGLLVAVTLPEHLVLDGAVVEDSLADYGAHGVLFVILTWFAASRVFQPAFLSWIQSLHSVMPRRDMAFLAPCSVHLKCLMISFRVWLLAVDSTSHV